VPGCQKLQMRLNPVWHKMLYSSTHVTTVGVKWLKVSNLDICDHAIPYLNVTDRRSLTVA